MAFCALEMGTDGFHRSPGHLQCLRNTHYVIVHVCRNVELHQKKCVWPHKAHEQLVIPAVVAQIL